MSTITAWVSIHSYVKEGLRTSSLPVGPLRYGTARVRCGDALSLAGVSCTTVVQYCISPLHPPPFHQLVVRYGKVQREYGT